VGLDHQDGDRGRLVWIQRHVGAIERVGRDLGPAVLAARGRVRDDEVGAGADALAFE
jgi:hypothetical protein